MWLYVTINKVLKSQNAIRKGKHLKDKWQEQSSFLPPRVTLSLEESKRSKHIPQKHTIQFEAWLQFPSFLSNAAILFKQTCLFRKVCSVMTESQSL